MTDQNSAPADPAGDGQDTRPAGGAKPATHFGSGDRVTHATYGDGTVSSVNEYHTKIVFDEHGLRTFVSPRVVLTASSTPAPVKKRAAVRRPRAAKATTATATATAETEEKVPAQPA